MTVNELIEQLKNYPGDSMVVIPGYEGGFDNPSLATTDIVVDYNWDGENKKHWCEGRHGESYQVDRIVTDLVNAVVVGRGK